MSKPSVPLEVCINADDHEQMRANIDIVVTQGARRIELCGAMHDDGLTPSLQAIKIARKAAGKAQLLVMLRPRRGNFVYSNSEFHQILDALDIAKNEGADGVVTGVLTEQRQVNIVQLEDIVNQANECDLDITFHRAFDALAEPIKACSILAKIGVKRVLTSGTPWGSGLNATQGVHLLQQYTQHDSGIEWVVGGGVNPNNAQGLLTAIGGLSQNISLHVYRGVMQGEQVDPTKVKRLVNLRY